MFPFDDVIMLWAAMLLASLVITHIPNDIEADFWKVRYFIKTEIFSL